MAIKRLLAPSGQKKGYVFLSLELLEAVGLGLLKLAGDEGERHDAADVHLGAEDVGVKTELLSRRLHVLETLLVVGTGTTDPDGHVVLLEDGRNLEEIKLVGRSLPRRHRGTTYLTQGADDTLERRRDVGEVGNTTTNEENLVLGLAAEEKVEDGPCVVECLALSGTVEGD